MQSVRTARAADTMNTTLTRSNRLLSMKKYILFLGASLLTLAACNKEVPVEDQRPANEETVLTFTSNRPQLDAGTKTAWNPATSSIDWTENDKIRVGYTLNGTWMAKDGQADLESETKVPARFFASESVDIDSKDAAIGTFSVPNSFTNEPAGTAVFYGVYPSTVTGTDASFAPSLTITLPASQTPGTNTFDPAADIMVGNSDEIVLSGSFPTEAIEMNWNRVVAHADLTFSNLAVVEGETISNITLAFDADAKVVGSFYVNVATGAVTTNSNSKSEIVLSGTNLSLNGNSVEAWACLMPATFTGVDVEIETNKAVYTRSISGINKTFVKNSRNTLTINMVSATRTPKSGQLVADGYYVISYDNQMMTVGTETESYRGYATKDVTSPSNDAIWRINYVSTDDAYTILSLGAIKELRGVTTDNNQLYLGTTNGTNLFTIKKSSGEATTYRIAPKGNTSRAIGYNTSSPRFALYAGNTQQPITLDLTAVTVDETPVITIETEERTKSVKANATSVVFAYSANVFVTGTPTVTVAEDDTHIISGTPVVADGTITVALVPNKDATAKTATLSVSGTGIASTITLTINQAAKTGDVYTYTFTSKSWAATRDGAAENWTSGKDGSQFTSGRGIQIATGATGANGTSPYTFTDVEEITVTYSTNASSGAGSIAVQVGNNTAKSITVNSTGGALDRTLTYSYSPKESGNVKITVTCTTNSIYVKDISITAASLNIPDPHTITCATGLSHGSVAADKVAARPGETVTLTATPETGYELDEWSVFKTGEETTKVTVTGNSFVMPDYDVTVSASFSEQSSGGTEKTSTLTFTKACGGGGTADDGTEWTVTSDGSESNYDSTKGIHYGTGSAQVQYIKLTTSDITRTIKKVVVNAATASGVSATAGVTVDGAVFGGAAQSLSTSAANYTFEGSASGEIIVTVTKPSSATGALYVKSIAVTYE